MVFSDTLNCIELKTFEENIPQGTRKIDQVKVNKFFFSRLPLPLFTFHDFFSSFHLPHYTFPTSLASTTTTTPENLFLLRKFVKILFCFYFLFDPIHSTFFSLFQLNNNKIFFSKVYTQLIFIEMFTIYIRFSLNSILYTILHITKSFPVYACLARRVSLMISFLKWKKIHTKKQTPVYTTHITFSWWFSTCLYYMFIIYLQVYIQMHPHVWAYEVLFDVLVLTQNVLRGKDDEGTEEGRKVNKKLQYTFNSKKMLLFLFQVLDLLF